MIRCATLNDCDTVIALWVACELTRPWNDAAADFERAVNGPTSDILLLEKEGHLTATVMVGDDGHRGWVYYLGVSPDFRDQGLGRALMEAAEKWLRERDAPKIQLMVRDDNEQAIGFYKTLGYEAQPVVTIGRKLS
tara:strand:- start:2293 stop:2700 length:408 start_codon:yes stop_codon:yes gene_type:complete